MSETDLDEIRAQIEEKQAKIDAIRADLDELAETTDVDLSGLRGRLDEHERDIEETRETVATTEQLREAQAAGSAHDVDRDDVRGFR